MSTFIPPGLIGNENANENAGPKTQVPVVPPLSAETSINPEAGSEITGSNGESFVVTDVNSSAEFPVLINGPEEGFVQVASGITGAVIQLSGDSTDAFVIGNAVDASGNVLDASGTAFQVAEDFEGIVIANLDGALSNNGIVDLNTPTAVGTISDAAGGTIGEGGLSGDFSYYVSGGAGEDQIAGSSGADFIRGGAGNDLIQAGDGDDLVRVGAGSDIVELGSGADVLYWTVDQFEGNSVNSIRDFTSGEDTIAIDADLADRIDVEFTDGNQAFTVTLFDSDGNVEGKTIVVSQNDEFDFPNDFAFV